MKILMLYHLAMVEKGNITVADLAEEWGEFCEDWSWGELLDVLHSLVRLLTRSTWVGFIVYPVAIKHVNRYLKH